MSEALRFQIVLGDGFPKEENGLELLFTYRLLGREEYRSILEMAEDESEIDELICMACVEEDYDWRGGLAGAATTVSDNILKSSGLAEGQADFLLELFRNELYSNPDYQRDCMIVEAFPHLDIEEVQNWPVVKHLYYYTRAEYILTVIRGKQIRFIDEEQIRAAEEMQNVPSPRERAAHAPDPEWMQQPEPAQSNGEMTEADLMRLLGATEVSKDLDKESMHYYSQKDKLIGKFD